MDPWMAVRMGRGEFLRAALLLAGGTLLDVSFPKGRVHAAEMPQARFKPFKGPIVTEVTKAGEFYPAEEYHQHYYKKNPIRYRYYRNGCGRDQRLKELWGDAAGH